MNRSRISRRCGGAIIIPVGIMVLMGLVVLSVTYSDIKQCTVGNKVVERENMVSATTLVSHYIESDTSDLNCYILGLKACGLEGKYLKGMLSLQPLNVFNSSCLIEPSDSNVFDVSEEFVNMPLIIGRTYVKFQDIFQD